MVCTRDENTQKTNVLLVWCKYPEDNWLFKIDNITEKQLKTVIAADALAIEEKSEALHKIAAAVGDKKRTEADPEWDSIWVDKRVFDIIPKPIDRIYACGWPTKRDEEKVND